MAPNRTQRDLGPTALATALQAAAAAAGVDRARLFLSGTPGASQARTAAGAGLVLAGYVRKEVAEHVGLHPVQLAPSQLTRNGVCAAWIATLSFFADWRMVALLAPAIESAGLRLQAMPIWDKETAGLGTGFRAQHECVLHFSIETPTYFSKRQGNVLNAKRPPSERDHPTEKPVALMAKLVDVQSGPGGLVLDPFMGSGSTGVAAIQHGRRFVGIEHDPAHFDTACRRLETAWKSPRLFREPAAQGSLLDGGGA